MFNYRIQDLLWDSFQKNKTRIAIQDDIVELTYEDIDNITDNIINDNCEKITNKKCNIITNDTINRIISMISVIKGNGVFINVDTDTPDNKILTLINNIEYDVILIDDEKIKNIIKESNTIQISYKKININKQIPKWINKHLLCDDELYVAFTSGTTGIPKLISGRNISLAHFINWQINKIQITSKEVFGQITTPNFDVFLRDVFTPLCSGARIIIPPKEYKNNFRQLLRWIYNNKITSLHCTPSVLDTFLNIKDSEICFELLHNLFLAGKKITIHLMQKWYNIGTKASVYGFYGPTETTLAKMYCKITKDCLNKEYISLGEPIDDTTIYLKDEQQFNVTNDIVGEIHISTIYSSFGYIKNEVLNNERFYKDAIIKGNTVYRTGDRAIRYSDGSIRFIGRNDRQVKINGIRCELDEIEFYIENNSNIQNAAVIYQEENESLIYFYVTSNTTQINELIKIMSDYFSSALIPKSFIRIEYMPLNINGKKDYQLVLAGELKKISAEETNDKTANKIITLIEKIFKINLSSNMLNLKINTLIDSLEYLNKLVDLEQELGVEFNEDIYIADNFESLINLITMYLKNNG